MHPRSPTRRALLGAGAALAVAQGLPSLAWARQDRVDAWKGGRLWIVGAGGFGLQIEAAAARMENLKPRRWERIAAPYADGDVLLLTLPQPASPLSFAAWRAELVGDLSQVAELGTTAFVLIPEDASAEAWSKEVYGIAAEGGAHVIDLNTFPVSVDHAQTAASAPALAAGILRRIGLYLPLRERDVYCVRTPIAIESPSCKRQMRAVAYVPDDNASLPTLYLLHGAWGAFSDWSLAAHDKLAKAAMEHRVNIVCPEGLEFGWYLDSPLVAENQIRTHILDELIPHVRQNLPATDVRSIGGLSMGGHGALLLALTHPGQFRSASSMSGAVDVCHVPKSKQITRLLGPFAQSEEAWIAHSAARQLIARPEEAKALPMKLACGTEDIWFETNREVHEGLDKRGIAHEWEATAGAGHTWDYWIDQLPAHVAFHAQHLHGA